MLDVAALPLTALWGYAQLSIALGCLRTALLPVSLKKPHFLFPTKHSWKDPNS